MGEHYRLMRVFYDKQTKDLGRELFKKDFEKYGYNQTNITI